MIHQLKNTDRTSKLQKEMDKFLRNDVEVRNLKHRRMNRIMKPGLQNGSEYRSSIIERKFSKQ